MEVKNAKLKEMNSGYKEILEKHKKTVESDVEKVTTQEKTAKERLAIKKEVMKKKAIYKKAMKERKNIVQEKIMDNANKEKIDIGKNSEEEPKEPKVVITR